ncbi:helix-turn-helix transcriptional regulator [Nocardioides zhouii]|nr:response regulator transcription factor [Nocardioides zhouii]
MPLFDKALALVFAALAFVETLGADGGHPLSFDLTRAGLAAATVATRAGRRTWPSLMALGFAAGMTIESLVTESPDQMAVLFAAMIASYSVAAHAASTEAALGIGLLGIAVSVAIAVDPSDDLSNIPPTLALFVLLPGAFGFAWARRSRDVDDLAARVSAAEDALAEERQGKQRRPVAAMPLTERQHDVVLLVARGFSNKEIAAALHLSENTVKGYVSDILTLHDLRDRTQLVIRAYDTGLVAPPEPRA